MICNNLKETDTLSVENSRRNMPEDGRMTETCSNQINSKKTYDINVP
jgi:hypothetical protein